MKIFSLVAAVFICLLAGCTSPKPAKPVEASDVEASGARQKFEADDDFKIETAVYGYLLEKHPWPEGTYTAIFLEGSDERVGALIKKLPHQVLPVKPGGPAQRNPNQAPMDQGAGGPGILLSAKAVDPTNGVSEAIGTWNCGEAGAGLYAFVLVEINGDWTIQSAK